MKFAVQNLPAGHSNAATGIISELLQRQVFTRLHYRQKIKKGKASKKLPLRPAMKNTIDPANGMEQLELLGLSVSDAKVRSSANAMVNSGLINHGLCT